MANTAAPQTARVEFRMPMHLKAEVEEAAALVGATFTSFATEILVDRARQIKREHAQTVLTDRERDAFLEIMADSSQPSDALVKMMGARAAI